MVCRLQVTEEGRCRVVPHVLDTTQDQWLEEEEVIWSPGGVQEFVSGLGALDLDRVDFGQALRYRIDHPDVPSGVRQLVLEVLDGCLLASS